MGAVVDAGGTTTGFFGLFAPDYKQSKSSSNCKD